MPGAASMPQLLTAAAERATVAKVVPACRETEQIEVALVNRDVARKTGVRVHAAAEHELTGARFANPHADIFETGIVELVLNHVHLRRVFRVEDAKSSKPHPRVFELRVIGVLAPAAGRVD